MGLVRMVYVCRYELVSFLHLKSSRPFKYPVYNFNTADLQPTDSSSLFLIFIFFVSGLRPLITHLAGLRPADGSLKLYIFVFGLCPQKGKD